jgi:hypothetical protein
MTQVPRSDRKFVGLQALTAARAVWMKSPKMMGKK